MQDFKSEKGYSLITSSVNDGQESVSCQGSDASLESRKCLSSDLLLELRSRKKKEFREHTSQMHQDEVCARWEVRSSKPAGEIEIVAYQDKIVFSAYLYLLLIDVRERGRKLVAEV